VRVSCFAGTKRRARLSGLSIIPNAGELTLRILLSALLTTLAALLSALTGLLRLLTGVFFLSALLPTLLATLILLATLVRIGILLVHFRLLDYASQPLTTFL
jgi:hypothetical protein